jgi:class 3 adenylate cyclase
MSRYKILVADDDPVSQSILCDLINSHFYEAVVAESGEEAWEKLQSDPCLNLVLIDWMMPGMDGPTLCSKIKSEITDRYVYAIMVTGRNTKADMVLGLENGADDFLGKPIHEGELLSRLHAGQRVLSYDLQLRAQMRQTDALMESILPAQVAKRLKQGESFIADSFPSASILFMDIVGFSTWCHGIDVSAMISQLSGVFAIFDEEMRTHRVEKIKSIGDAYLVASGLPEPCEDHAERLVNCALSIQARLKDLNRFRLHPWELRIGIASGRVVGGVIGDHRFVYDVWGDTVNRAARLEQAASPGQILVDSTTRAQLGPLYACEKRGSKSLKGVGTQVLWEVTGHARSVPVPTRADEAPPPSPSPSSIPHAQSLLPGYTLHSVLAQSGFSVTYEASRLLDSRAATVRLVPEDAILRREPAYTERFLRLSRAAMANPHPGIAEVFESGRTESGLLYFVSAYLQGTPLPRIRSGGHPTPIAHTLEIGAGLLELLEFAHSQGIVHGHLSPSHVLLLPEGRVQVAGIGFARPASIVSSHKPHPDLERGSTTHPFDAPEQIGTGRVPDVSSDVYSAGAILCWLLTGEASLEQAGENGARDIPNPLQKVIAQATAVDPSDRFQSVSDFLQAWRATATPECATAE